MKKLSLVLLLGLVGSIILSNCSGSKKLSSTPYEVTLEEDLDTVVVTPDLNIEPEEPREYQATFSRQADLIHTRLKVRFDWDKKFVIGEADLTLTAVARPIDIIELHAQGFDLSSVRLNGKPARHSYDSKTISISLDTPITISDTINLSISYVAKPDELPENGSAAIQSDKGLFFINPSGRNKNKPTQIWTQGETENNSRWLPTIDKPNERCTQEFYVTVEEKFKTLSNGQLVSQTVNSDGTRTDYWRLDLPHAPYLFMLAVGDFAIIKDQWKSIPVEYYVEPHYAEDAKMIFNHTPEMLQFFSDYTGISYPWPKYSQIVVRDYVSGAMENTTAVVFGDFIQKTSREILDDPNDYIIAHEMIHHWFGNMVTCESWANLTLNEGFANYGEYLWNEYKYGKDVADYSRQNEIDGYLNQVSQGDAHPLIDHYMDKEAMFDAHSYNKGGLVLHMLRDYLGEDLFKKGLNYYLKQHAFASVETADLRLAFEKVSGEDLMWFFDQWFFNSGHPVLDVTKSVNGSEVSLTIAQKQDANASTLFTLPLEIVFYDSTGRVELKKIWVKKQNEVFTFNLGFAPTLVLIDPRDILLKQMNYERTIQEYQTQYLAQPALVHRTEALAKLEGDSHPKTQTVLLKALEDNHWSIRQQAIELLTVKESEEPLVSKLVYLAQQDNNPSVRTAAIKKLSKSGNKKYLNTLKAALQTDSSYQVLSGALVGLYELDPTEALSIMPSYEHLAPLKPTILHVYAQEKDPKYYQYFKTVLAQADGYDYLTVLSAFSEFCLAQPPSSINNHAVIAFFKDLATDQEKNLYTRYGSAKFISDLKDFSAEKQNEQAISAEEKSLWSGIYQAAKAAFNEVKTKETSPQLRNAYMFMN